MNSSVNIVRLSRRLLLGASLGAVLCAAPALAEDADQAADAAANASGAQVGEIVVTGAHNKQKVLETSYGVTVLNDAQIEATSPVGLTDLASSIPGLQGEHSNGEVNSNLNVRGTEAGFISFISLQEDGLPTQYTPFFAEYEIRDDLTYGRVEAVLGGPSGIFTAQGAAATLNFLSRQPTEFEGKARVSVTDYGEYRGDLFVGGPLGGGWFGTIGGYFRQGDTPRGVGYTANSGGQVRASIRKVWDNGKLSIAYKKIDDHTDYVNPLPVDVSGTYPAPLPGFNARDDSLMGPNWRYLDAIRPSGIERRDVGLGQQAKIDQITIAGEYQVSDRVTISNKARYVNTNTSSLDVRGYANASLVNGTTFLAAQLPALQAAFPTATSARFVRVTDGAIVTDPATMNGNGLATTAESIDYLRWNKTFIDQFEVNYTGDKVTLTAGLQYWNVNDNSGMLGDQVVHDIRNHANLLDVQALDANGNVVGQLTNHGILAYSTTNARGGLDTSSINPYLNLQFKVSDKLRIDAGIRYEHSSIKSWAQDFMFNTPMAAPYYNANTLATRSYSVMPNGVIARGHTTMEAVSWTIGANLKLNDNLAVYGRFASAGDMGFNNEFSMWSVPAYGTPLTGNMGLTNKETRLNFGEFGVRYLGSVVSGSVTAFYTLHKNSGIVSVNSNGANIITPVDTKAYGAEFWFDIKPSEIFKVSISGVVMNSSKTGSGFNSIPTYRLPGTQLRVSPTLTLGKVDLNLTGQYYGIRYADQSATRKLPAYVDLSASIAYNISDDVKLTLQARNLLNKFAFTSGNFREGFTQGPNRYGYASAIPGRVLRAMVDFSF